MKIDIIATGYNKYCSQIPNEDWDSLPKHTNAVEVLHHKSNSFGKRLTLLQAIRKYV
jgi:hypothetical protein